MSTALPAAPPPPWKPSRYLEPTHPPPDEAIKREQYEAALAASALWNGGVDFAGRPPKLLKPRRTVDYAAGAARYQTVRLIPSLCEGYCADTWLVAQSQGGVACGASDTSEYERYV